MKREERIKKIKNLKGEKETKVKTRKEALQDEIKIYGDMIRETEADLREARIDINVKNLKYRINSYKKQIEEDYIEIAEIEEGATKEKMERTVVIKLKDGQVYRIKGVFNINELVRNLKRIWKIDEYYYE